VTGKEQTKRKCEFIAPILASLTKRYNRRMDAPPPRRRFQFRLRTLFAVATIEASFTDLSFYSANVPNSGFSTSA
jgi:hypothetical protein